MVHVLSKNGTTLMPTENHAKVRILLKEHRAIVSCTKPFQIRLLYDVKELVEETVTKMDTGRKNIAVTVLRKRDGKHLMSVVLTTRNKDVPKLMAERAMYRTNRRGYRRAKKVRLARSKNTTTVGFVLLRKLERLQAFPLNTLKRRRHDFSTGNGQSSG